MAASINGKTRPKKRTRILFRDEFRCQYCFKEFAAKDLHLDHVIPLARGGTNRNENLVACCQPCQHAKADRSVYALGLPDWHLRRLHPLGLANLMRIRSAPPEVMEDLRKGIYVARGQSMPALRRQGAL
jgi:hypothetical protein